MTEIMYLAGITCAGIFEPCYRAPSPGCVMEDPDGVGEPVKFCADHWKQVLQLEKWLESNKELRLAFEIAIERAESGGNQ